jgi:hypothetical protein
MSIKIILLILAVIAFALGAAGVQAAVNWDQAGKALVVASLLF